MPDKYAASKISLSSARGETFLLHCLRQRVHQTKGIFRKSNSQLYVGNNGYINI